MENTSGHGKSAVVPRELDYWNWGAFLLNWIWGIGNNTFIALLMFVPLVNVVMLFVLGVKGNTWAWRNKYWRDVDHFKQVQRKWAIWGVVIWIGFFGLQATFWFSIFGFMKRTEVYQMAVARLVETPEAISALGTPISTGTPWGSFTISGPEGRALFSFSAKGPKGAGTVYVRAIKDFGRWSFNRIELEVEGRAERIDLGDSGSARRKINL